MGESSPSPESLSYRAKKGRSLKVGAKEKTFLVRKGEQNISQKHIQMLWLATSQSQGWNNQAGG